ncbi:MAG TPA: hypothetical protein VH020_08240 [Stellaceae bacterium]|jgi:hypothetical protein|nr:hypothetical protein [Stellaceae bacterium]
MWKDWLERTLTRNNAPVMLASELLCPEPANGNVYGPPLPLARLPKQDTEPEPAEAQ